MARTNLEDDITSCHAQYRLNIFAQIEVLCVLTTAGQQLWHIDAFIALHVQAHGMQTCLESDSLRIGLRRTLNVAGLKGREWL